MLRICLILAFLFPLGALAEDRLQLDEAAIVGSRELPKVLYIVPWKNAKLGALQSGAGSASFGAQWDVVKRDEFRRQVEYYETLYAAPARSR
jgi:hypothetical protein